MSLRDRLIAQIRALGPISVAEYMNTCLMDPKDGYYTNATVFGRQGDFITAPEISQMFGEMVGLALAQAWLDQGAPAAFALVELGPGRGTLMADALRATRTVPGLHAAARIVLVESSPRLREVQRATLTPTPVDWADTVDALPQQPLFFIANEFFDALPVRQFIRDGEMWRERQVGLSNESLSFGLGPALPQPALAHRLHNTAQGDMVEETPAAAPLLRSLTQRILDHGGAGLIIDYGGWASTGDTLQAVRKHEKLGPLDAPGTSDLTAHVDFAALAAAAAPARVSAMTPQGVFLERLGITARAQSLARTLSGPALDAHIAAHRRLTHPLEMGNLFQVLGICSPGAPPLPGLDP